MIPTMDWPTRAFVRLAPLFLGAIWVVAACSAPAPMRPGSPLPTEIGPRSTFANPLNVDYRFELIEPSHRTAADPVIVLYEDEYYLFATKSGGYWYSPNLRDWTLVVPRGLPLEDPAPAILIRGDQMYYTAHRSRALYVSDDPKGGSWRRVTGLANYPDPAFFTDDDGRVYLYYGAALNGSISVVELDPRDNFRVVAGPFELMRANFAEHGWERSGEDNLGAWMSEGFRNGPYIEGPWMTKHNGIYYLQYSAPGTVWKTYADGVYTSRSPTGGFSYAPYSPFSYKPGGFIGSAGHGGLFQDRAGNYWRVVTMVISVAHRFERRLGIFPAGFDRDGVIRTDSYLGDYPQFLPGVTKAPLDGNLTGWMLLSSGKQAAASSGLTDHPPGHAFDEEIRTHWSARTGDPGEWLRVDLGGVSRIDAVQVNFAEQDTHARGRGTGPYHQYIVEISLDGVRWSTLIDRSRNTTDVPHDYVQLDQAAQARHIRITNVHAAAGGKFAIRDLRVFGQGTAPLPAEVKDFTARRDPSDARNATVAWSRAPGAQGYIVRFGIAPDKLYSHYQVGDVTSLTLNSLNSGVTYYFSVDAFNERGIAKGTTVRRDTP
ncbi:MAG: family 43 glycosylhydrolase [Gemmatimonadota bacterium]|nr:family 43 glycosylhydrolase [Gemmatimonadota bacterium]